MNLRKCNLLQLCFALLVAMFVFTQSAAAASTTISDADKGKSITLHTGDELVVQLKSNPSTGYEWGVEDKSTALLKLTGQSRVAPPNNGMVGSPGQQIFHFATVKKGAGTLRLHYVRAWEKPSASDTEFTVRVVIQ